MALLFMDSFDHYVTADILAKYVSSSLCSIVAGAGRRGSAALRFVITAGGEAVTPSFPAPSTTVVCGIAYKTDSFGGLPQVFQIRSVGVVQCSIALNATGFLQIYRGTNAGTLLGTASTGQLSTGSFFYIEAKIVVHPSAGSCVLRVNEIPVLTLTGLNTAATGGAGWDNVRLNIGSGTPTVNLDDFYVLDGSGPAPLNDLLGDCRVLVSLPTAEGGHSDWTPLSGTNNATMVNQTAPDGDTTYNGAFTIGLIDTFTPAAVSLSGAALYAVQLVSDQRKTDAGTCTIAPVVRSGGTDAVGTVVAPVTTYTMGLAPYGLHPVTGVPWTEATFNASEFGYKRVT